MLETTSDASTYPDRGVLDATPDSSSDSTPNSKTDADLAPDSSDQTDVATLDKKVGEAGQCSQTKTGTSGLVLKGKLLLPNGEVESEGEVLIGSDGLIACASKTCSADPKYASASIVSCTHTVISPALINPHDHITYANTPPADHGKERYEHRNDWRLGERGHKKISVAKPSSGNVILAAELRFVMSGVVSGATAGGENGLMRNLDSAGKLEGLPVKVADSDTFPLGSEDHIDSGCTGYSKHKKTSALVALDSYLPHISEGIDKAAHSEFVCSSQAGEYDILTPDTAVIHGIAVDPGDVKIYRDDRAILIWSPRSNIDLYGDTAPVVLYRNSGVPIALGTDWLPSGSMNISRELRCASDLNDYYFDRSFSDVDLWQMVTENSALALGAFWTIGQLKKGYVADITLFSEEYGKDHRAVLNATPQDVMLTMRAGKALYGNKSVLDLAAFTSSDCEEMDVCGTAKRACVAKDIGGGVTLEAVRREGEKIYPLFQCRGVPLKKEPSCIPFRKNEYEGGRTAQDKDGDGVADELDNCPTIFNPKRPMYDGAQGDKDGDGQGDACDLFPLEAKTNSSSLSADDADGDSVVNASDNCPDDQNPDQEDTDKDGYGDACDHCLAGPGPECATSYRIAELRDPNSAKRPAKGSLVKLNDVYVSAVRTTSGSRGFFVQSGVEPYSGFYAFLGSSSLNNLAVGNKVSVEGRTDEFSGLDELSDVSFQISDKGTTFPFDPVEKSTTELADPIEANKWVGMLIGISHVSVSNLNPDTPNDYKEFTVKTDGATKEFRVDDYMYFARKGLTIGQKFDRIIGIGGAFKNATTSNYKLWPRGSYDFIAPSQQP